MAYVKNVRKETTGFLEDWQKRQLKDFFRTKVSAPDDYGEECGEMKMPLHSWQSLQEHCQKEMEKLKK